MLEIVLEQPGKIVAKEGRRPQAASGEALVRVRRIGVCGTDLHAFAGRQPFFQYPRILGHELGVEVVEVGPNEFGIQQGDHCAVEPYLACSNCYPCRLGRTNCCESLAVLGVHTDGGMRPYLTVPLHLLHRSQQLSLDQLALVETLGIGAHAVDRSAVEPGQHVLVVGAGPIGLAVVQFALASGAKVSVLEMSQPRRAFVSQFNVEACSTFEGRTAEIVFDATGNKRAMDAAFQFVGFAGKLVFVGLVQDEIALPDPLFHRREMTLLASRNSAGLFPQIIRQIEQGQIDTRPWITHRLALADVPRDFQRLPQDVGLVKAMVEV